MSMRGVFLALLSGFTVLRWLWNAPIGLSPADAYLALCGYQPSIAYFEGPGGTALCVALGTSLAGADAMGAALLWPLFAALATLALYALVKPLAGDRAALASAVLLNLLPAFNAAALAPSAAMPLAMFGLGFMACAWRALGTSSLLWWLAAGLCAAGGLLFSYAAWLLLPALALLLLLSHRWRSRLWEPGFWLATAAPATMLVLLLRWNGEHGWVHFIGGTMQTALTLHPDRIPSAGAGIAGGLSPLVALALGIALGIAMREIRGARSAKFLVIPALAAALQAVYLHLTGDAARTAGLLAAALTVPVLAWLVTAAERRDVRFLRPALIAVFVTAAAWTAAFLAVTPRSGSPINADVAAGIETLRRQVSERAEQPAFLIAQDARLASGLALYLPDRSSAIPGHPPVYVVESPHADSQYALWPRYDQFVEGTEQPAPDDPFTEQAGHNLFLWRSALYVTRQAPDDLPQAVTAAFAALRLLAEITTPTGEILRIYLCEEYETLPL